MVIQVPPALSSVLQYVVDGFTNADIADALGKRDVAQVNESIRKLKQLFTEAGEPEMLDPRLATRTALALCGKRYFEQQASLRRAGKKPDLEQRLETLRTEYCNPIDYLQQLMFLGGELAGDYSWQDAAFVYEQAEQGYGNGSSQAARAALESVLMRVELGDYDGAHTGIVRVEHEYEPVMDMVVRARMYEIMGWLGRYQGNLIQAKSWLETSLGLSAQMGIIYVGETAQHFLGLVYFDLGQLSSGKPEREDYFNKAVQELERAYAVHHGWTEDYQAYDLFRMSQVLLAQRHGAGQEAARLRARARQMFGGDLGYLNVDLEEARLALMDNSTRIAKRLVEKALEGWTDANHAKGIADSLGLLGDVEFIRGKPYRAFKLYVAALCVYPYDNSAVGKRIWENIRRVSGVKGSKIYQRWVENVKELAEEREGEFSHIESVAADRMSDIERIIGRLALSKPR